VNQDSGRRQMSRQYRTIAEVAELARVSPKRIRNLMADGTLREGEHFTRPEGLRPRFILDRVLSWLEAQRVDDH
jgi:hypothetical protein